MNTFQIIVLPILAILFIERLLAVGRGRGSRRVALLWAVLWLLAGVAVAWPGLTKDIARAVGIGRGADLVMYLAIIAMFVGFFLVYARMRRLEANITRLVRHIAIEGAQEQPASDEPRRPVE